MRVTGNQLIDQAAAATQRSEQQVSTASSRATSGLRVETPSDDPVAWALSRRAADRATLSAGRASAIGQGRDRLQLTDGALGQIGDLVSLARSLAVQGANDTVDAAGRAALGTQVAAYLQQAIAAANTRSSDGEYVLAGNTSTTPPFDAAGVYHGDAGARSIESGEGQPQIIGVPGSALTSAGGPLDVLPTLGALAAALTSNNLAGIRSAIDTLSTAGKQISVARSDAGAAMTSLNTADDARTQLEITLAETKARAVELDPVAAVSELSKASNALETSQAVAQRVFSLASILKNGA